MAAGSPRPFNPSADGERMKIFPAVRMEGGLFAPDLFERVINQDLPGQKPADFGLSSRQDLINEVAAVFADARSLWEVFKHRLERLPEEARGERLPRLTREYLVIPLLGLLGYELHSNHPHYYKEGGLTFRISHRAGEDLYAPPVHIVSFEQPLGQLAERSRFSPHSLVQEFLNRTEALWGLVTNGKLIRLLRDSTYLRRQCYLEFDLEAIFEQHLFEDFLLLFRLLHRSRLPSGAEDASQCLLEQYYQLSLEEGERARDRLRDSVVSCLTELAQGFLSHPENTRLRERLSSPDDSYDALAFYRDLLRLIYRFLFLLVAEDRGLLSDDPLYREHYSVSRFRRLAENRSFYTEHEDLWLSLRVLWKLLSDATPQAGDKPLASYLGLSPLNGELFSPLFLDECLIRNRELLSALWWLLNYRESEADLPHRINYAALDVEELGSVYESLLDYQPTVTKKEGQVLTFELNPGTERKSTGSYYTPAPLVAELIRSALEPVIEERLKEAKRIANGEWRTANYSLFAKRALLSIKVVDPACGSGHFLLAAARRLGKELARIETGEDEPSPEAVREAVREVIAHCIYGVDKNPLAVELCRVALWIEAHVPGKPLTFLDHHIKCGDSLVGVFDLNVLTQGIPDEAFRPLEGDERSVCQELRNTNRRARRRLFGESLFNPKGEIEKLAEEFRKVDELAEDTVEALHEKTARWQALRRKPEWEKLKRACDLWTSAFFVPKNEGTASLAPTSHDLYCLFANPGALSPQKLAQAEALAEKHRFFHWPLEFPEVFARGGFDVVLGNPPFMGGLKIGRNLGRKYRQWLEMNFNPFKGTADLCSAFFRRGYDIIRKGGYLGMVATNTIGQGDTRESGLAIIVKRGGAITFARRFVKWPGAANVEVNLVAINKKGQPNASFSSLILDGEPVAFISSRLDDEPEAEPKRLPQNEGKAFIGDYVRGIGFVLEPEEAEALLAKDPRYADCLFPYLNGEDLNSHPEQKPSRWVICFHDWTLERAKKYSDLLRIVEERVKPERERLRGPSDRRDREHWWLFARYRGEMRPAIAPLRRVLVRSRVSELHMLAFVPKEYIYGDATVVFAFEDHYHFALLQSNVHEAWIRRQASSLRTDVRYTPTTCFETFPFPPEEYRRITSGEWRLEDLPAPFKEASRIGEEYHEHRRQIMLKRWIGLTKTYNLFHDPNCTDADIQRLRELHTEMDRAILACYGWDDINPKHGFYQNERGQVRFTISPKARREILHRLLELNLKIA